MLTREVGPDREIVAPFIMLNPSTADAQTDVATIRTVKGLCRRWGCGRLQVINLFALRSTDPSALRLAGDPVGPENVEWIGMAMHTARGGLVVCAWGTEGSYLDQDLAVLGLLQSWRFEPLL